MRCHYVWVAKRDLRRYRRRGYSRVPPRRAFDFSFYDLTLMRIGRDRLAHIRGQEEQRFAEAKGWA